MTYIITENCIKCKYTDCVEVCPVDCFHEGPNFLVINPEECIDCSLCEPECPINAIISDEDVTDDNRHFLEINERLSKKWPILTEIKAAPEDAKEWENKAGKLDCTRRVNLKFSNPIINLRVIILESCAMRNPGEFHKTSLTISMFFYTYLGNIFLISIGIINFISIKENN